tara:strand:+ start:623 stop:973 length:351 start_codon:yes stop_codon:yes gene_type:complete
MNKKRMRKLSAAAVERRLIDSIKDETCQYSIAVVRRYLTGGYAEPNHVPMLQVRLKAPTLGRQYCKGLIKVSFVRNNGVLQINKISGCSLEVQDELWEWGDFMDDVEQIGREENNR